MAARDYTLQVPTEDRFLLNEDERRGQIATLLGGLAAEEIILENVTTVQRATELKEQMVTSYGMSQILGPLAYAQAQQKNFLGCGMNARRAVSEQTANVILIKK